MYQRRVRNNKELLYLCRRASGAPLPPTKPKPSPNPNKRLGDVHKANTGCPIKGGALANPNSPSVCTIVKICCAVELCSTSIVTNTPVIRNPNPEDRAYKNLYAA
ncbi:hypothetical protein V1477_002963 [Vespula maculifrons]|uniref:Uncharacterized protein n=1 Tax=Vespula maculifrons TaxID=7453 RepID=A0ABD2CUN3_VESMC